MQPSPAVRSHRVKSNGVVRGGSNSYTLRAEEIWFRVLTLPAERSPSGAHRSRTISDTLPESMKQKRRDDNRLHGVI